MSQQTARLKTQLVRRVPLDKLKHVPPKHPPRDRGGFSSLLVARRAMGTRLKNELAEPACRPAAESMARHWPDVGVRRTSLVFHHLWWRAAPWALPSGCGSATQSADADSDAKRHEAIFLIRSLENRANRRCACSVPFSAT